MILETHFKYRNVNYKAILGTKLSHMHISTSKTIQVTFNIRNQDLDTQTVARESWAKSSQNHITNIGIMWRWIDAKIMQEIP